MLATQQQKRIVRRPPSYYEFLSAKYAQMQKNRPIIGSSCNEENTTSSSCSSSPRSVEDVKPAITPKRVFLKRVCFLEIQ